MLFVPLLKNRKVELRAISQICDCLSPTIIPLFELICDTEKREALVDLDTGKPLYLPPQPGLTRRKRIWDEGATRIITLETINANVRGKSAFIDIFRFKEDTYGRHSFSPPKVTLALRASIDEEFYISKLKEISQFSNFIPVISIKTGFPMKVKDLQELLSQLQFTSSSVAIRISEEFLEPFKQILEEQLRKEDYLLYDIGEQSAKAKIIELSELNMCNTSATKVLLNSTRPRSVNNTAYEEHGPTVLIDNSALSIYAKYNLEGFGDYCGMKDSLPSDGGGGKGSALALLFKADQNVFWSYRNANTNLGQSGFQLVKSLVLTDSANLDPDGDCPALKWVHEMPNCGGWQTWLEISIIRYIYQIYKFQQA